jgi:nuclear transport factor 2 (NTF2) superfamily protein
MKPRPGQSTPMPSATPNASAERAIERAREAEEIAQAERQDRVAAVATADEAVRNADELRRADAERKGRGRLARLRAAWRGE